jgi:quercetin dioxygenase-like cupin family protein
MAAPHLQLDLNAELQQLRREPEWTSGHSSKTLVKYDSLRVVLISLKARARIPEHQTEGRISIQTLQGHLRVRATERTFDLPTGALLALEQGLRHDVEALEDSALLLSIAWPVSRTDSR